MATMKNIPTLADAIRAAIDFVDTDREIKRLEDTALWKAYTVGYGLAAGAYTRKAVIDGSGMHKSAVSKAEKVAATADSNVKYRNALCAGKFGSLEAAYAACPKRKTSRSTVVTVTIKFTADGVTLPKMTAAQRKALKAAL